jgi:TatA/E family protein of Tat protein translocase
MGPLGWPETVFIVLLALLLFGPKKLPELGRMLGKAITEFRRASAELKSTFDREMRNLEREAQGIKETATSQFNDSYNYDYSAYDSGAPYAPELPASETPALNGTVSASEAGSPHTTEGVSALEGAPLTTAESHPAPVLTPAPGTVPSGSLPQEHAMNVPPGPIQHLDQSAEKEALKS